MRRKGPRAIRPPHAESKLGIAINFLSLLLLLGMLVLMLALASSGGA